MSSKRTAVPLTAGAEATRALLLKWEQQSPMEKGQIEILAEIAHLTSERPLPSHLVQTFEIVEDVGSERIEKEEDLWKVDVAFSSFDLFTPPLDLLSLSSTSSDIIFPEEVKYRPYIEYVKELQDCLGRSELVEKKVEVTKEHLRRIEEEYSEVSKKTSELYDLCEGLMSEERQLKMYGEEMRESLQYWEMLEKLWHQLNSPSLTAESQHFGTILKNIDEGILFFESHPRIRDGEVYRLKFKQMQSRALFLAKNFIVAFFKYVETYQPNVSVTLPANTPGEATEGKPDKTPQKQMPLSPPSLAELEKIVSMKNAQFKQLSSRIKPLVREIEKRASYREYSLLLNDIVNAYFQLRRNTLQNLMSLQINQIVKHNDLFKMVREGMLLFVRLCEDEYQHCGSIFHGTLLSPSSNTPLQHTTSLEDKNGPSNFPSPSALSPPSSTHLPAPTTLIQLRNWLESFFSLLNDHLRPVIIRTQNLALLCSLIDILQFETMDSFIDKQGNELEALRPIVIRLVEDIRERLIFVSNRFIRDEIADFVPSPTDLDYPSLLETEKMATQQPKSKDAVNPTDTLSSAHQQASTDPQAAREGSQMSERDQTDDSGAKETKLASSTFSSPSSPSSPSSTLLPTTTDSGMALDQFHFNVRGRGWYPTLEKTLSMLARLYVAIDAQSFGTIAQDAVLACFQTLCSASKLIEAKSGKMDAQLFLIKYLSILQDNIIPFEIDFFVKETNLDFGHARDLLRRILSGEISFSSLFALSSNNALVTILQSAAPRITHSERDMSKAMEDIMKQSMEAYIFSSTNASTLNLLPFIFQARSFLNSLPDPATNPSATSSSSLLLLAAQPYATPEAVQTLLADAIQLCHSQIPAIFSKLTLYLGHSAPSSHLIYASIKDNIIDSFENFASLVSLSPLPTSLSPLPTSPQPSNPYATQEMLTLLARVTPTALSTFMETAYLAC